MNQRASGILLHLSCLSNVFPIGDLGPAATAFVDFLVESGQSWWQMLPVGPAGGENSPYQSPSAFAGNPLLISPDRLVEQGFLGRQDIKIPRAKDDEKVNYPAAADLKPRLLKKAFENFKKDKKGGGKSQLDAFVREESCWLEDYSLFSAIGEQERTSDWTRWNRELRVRQPDALVQAKKGLADEMRYHQFVQWQFSIQWNELRSYCTSKGVRLIGDVPLFVSHQSSDVWAHPEIFKLDAAGNPAVVAGVPPDYFCKTGQMWGVPVYCWETLRRQNYRWWIDRLRMAFRRFDVNRLDHFIGFIRTYEVPAEAKTAVIGKYQAGGGASFFEAVRKTLGPVSFIGDDLGAITSEVVALLDQFQIPGTRVLQFEFGSRLANSAPSEPQPKASVVYTGTHDNDTTEGWYEKLPGTQREALQKQLAVNDREIVWAMIREAQSSPADTVIIPAQDLLELGSEARMNVPGTAKGSWEWRLEEGALTRELALRLRSESVKQGRFKNRDSPSVPPRQTNELTLQIAKRAYELYERCGRQDGQTVQNWLLAERQIELEAKT